MKVAFFNYLMLEYGGGLAKYFCEITSGLKKRYPHLDLTILTFDEKFSKKIQRLYVLYFLTKNSPPKKIEHVQIIKKKLQGVSYRKAKSIQDLKRTLQEFDIIYSKNDFVEAAILKLAGINGNSKVLFGFHTPIFYDKTSTLQDKLHNIIYNSFFYTYLLKNAKKFHVLNTFDKHLLEKKFQNIPVSLIPNPFNFQLFEKKAREFVYNIHPNPKKMTVLWVGRLTKEKGVLDLEKIITRINKLYEKKIAWIIVGNGQLIETVNEIKNKWGNIIHIPSVENDYMASIYQKADLYISTSHFECFPYTFLEAQSFGIPIISFNIHGCNDVVKHKKNGLLVKDLNSFSKAISNMVTNTTFNKERIKKYISRKYNEERLYQSFYNTLIKE